MERGPKLVKFALLLGLQLQLQFILPTATTSEAFQFWPGPFSSKASRQDHRTSAAPAPRHRLEASGASTSTTSAPIELHFEINADPPEAQRQSISDEPSFEVKTLNGSLILEDLVNQFERNFNQKKRGAESGDEVASAEQHEATHGANRSGTAERHLAEIVVEPTTEISLELVHSSSGLSVKPTPNDSLVDVQLADQEDRHIQYDNMSSLSPDELTHGPAPPNETEAIAQNFTLVPAQSDSRNFTLEPIRVQSERIVFNNNSLEDFRRRADAGAAQDDDDAGQVVYSNNTLLVTAANGQDQREPQARQKSHQARSMSAANGFRAAPAAQLSKPPYATSYNQFHHLRSELGAPAGQLVTTNNHNNRANIADGPQNSSNIQQRAPSGAVQAASPADGKSFQRGEELVNSINLISSHLAGEAARQQDEPNATATSSADISSSTSSSTTSTTTARPPGSVADVIVHSYEFMREHQQAQQRRELERLAAKLAPINGPTDLSPIPSAPPHLESVSPANRNHQVAPASEATPGLFYWSQAPFAELEESRSPSATAAAAAESSANFERLQNDRYSHGGATFESASNLFSQQLSEPANQLFVIRADGNQTPPMRQLASRAASSTVRPARVSADLRPHDGADLTPALDSHSMGSASASSLSLPFGPQLHRKTLELVSKQIQHADQATAVHQHKERSPNSLDQRRASGAAGSYAASLINVTAPMVLPLSATEAMEASLSADPAARQMMHQVGGGSSMGLSGGGVAAAAAAAAQDLHSAHSHQRPSASSPYQRPPSSYQAPAPQRDERLREPGYPSLSARPFSPAPAYTTTTSALESTFAGAAPSLDVSLAAGASLSSNGLSAAERERLRIGDLARTSPSGQQASGFRSPISHSGYLPSPEGLVPTASAWLHTTSLPTPSSYLADATSGRFSANGGDSTQTPPLAQAANNSSSSPQANRNSSAGQTPMRNSTAAQLEATSNNQSNSPSTTNGFLTGSVGANSTAGETVMSGSQQPAPQASHQLQVGSSAGVYQQQQQPPTAPVNKRVFNLTRVEHISAECSNDLIRTVIIFNGTFKGIIYSSGYVRDPSCMYVNGTGKTRYDFSIRLNQCGTLGRQELHPSSRPNELNRRDQVMWNTLSIQYNPIVEQEWDEHFRVSCEYGGDFWKTISFSPFNVETNTGAPVVFTVDPPQCQMEILKGHGMVGPRQEAVSGPVTVGDPLTLLIHMKSEKAGYDILVKNCIAHNGGQQKMQLIDNSGCVVNERFISPFRGTYNDNDLKHVTLYSYLKAFRFTGSPVLYLECEVHMCQSACPPQMCYWRTLSKRSINETRLPAGNDALLDNYAEAQPELWDESETGADVRSISFNLTASTSTTTTSTSTSTTTEPSAKRSQRRGRNLRNETSGEKAIKPAAENLSDRVSLFQALEVRQEREPESLPEASSYDHSSDRSATDGVQLDSAMILCYRRAEVFAFLFTVASILLAAISVTIGCCFRASSLKRQARHQAVKSQRQQQQRQEQFVSQALSLTSANLGYAPLTSYLSPSPSAGSSASSSASSSSSSSSSSYADSSQHSPTSGSLFYSPEVSGAANKQSASQLPACAVGSLGALIKQQQQQQLALAGLAARKPASHAQSKR